MNRGPTLSLGSTGRNEEINFEAQGITLAQALARAGGLNDARSDARGVFIFRFEPKAALDWPRQPVATTQPDAGDSTLLRALQRLQPVEDAHVVAPRRGR